MLRHHDVTTGIFTSLPQIRATSYDNTSLYVQFTYCFIVSMSVIVNVTNRTQSLITNK